MTPITTFSGLATGIDTGAIVTELVKLERRPIGQLQQKQSDLKAVQSRLTGLRSKLESLQEAATDLDARAEVLLSSASSSDEDKVTATADGAASLGTFDVEITSLASAQRTYSDAFAAKDTAGLFGTGTLSIQVGAEAAVDITVDASDTLDSLVSKINASAADVTAGLLFDGTNYRMQVSGNGTGLDNAVSFTETGLTLDLDDPANEVQAAADAIFKIDGFDMTRGSNLVSDAIPGVSLDLKEATAGPVSVTIARDPEALQAKVEGFVDAYNDVASTLNKEFAFGGQARIGDSLSGDSTLRGLQSRLRREMLKVVSGLSEPYNSAHSVGIEFKGDGTVELDTEALAEALADDPEAVARLFMDDQQTGISGLMANFDGAVDEYVQSGSGVLTVKIDSYDDRVDSIDDQISSMERRVEKFEERIRMQFSAMEQLVAGLQGQGQQMLAMLGQLGG